MKWMVGILICLVVGWKLAVFLANRNNGETVRLVSVDSLQAKQSLPNNVSVDTATAKQTFTDTILSNNVSLAKESIDTKGINPNDVVAFAKTQLGVPYLYGSTDPAKGFDCSGFITHVFNHFGIAVPRSSVDFTNVGREVSAAQAKEGDLILFTGTDSTEGFIGHMGIVMENTDSLRFIHSSSGKAKGVTITPLNSYYKSRYVKTIRIFPQNNF